MDFSTKPVISCVHLLPTPGSPLYGGDIGKIYDAALSDARIFTKYGADGLIVENFRDGPFYPDSLPPESIATLAGVTREIVSTVDIPVGVAALRNDARGAIAIATAVGASFVRINVHIGAILSEQGIIQGKSHETLRLRETLKSNVLIFADAAVKHSTPLVYNDLTQEIRDLSARADAIIVSGTKTGVETKLSDLAIAKEESSKPVIVGSGLTKDNFRIVYGNADGFIVGSYFKKGGVSINHVEEARVKTFMEIVIATRNESK